MKITATDGNVYTLAKAREVVVDELIAEFVSQIKDFNEDRDYVVKGKGAQELRMETNSLLLTRALNASLAVFNIYLFKGSKSHKKYIRKDIAEYIHDNYITKSIALGLLPLVDEFIGNKDKY